MDSAICNVCFRHCSIKEGGLGFCGARTCKDSKVICASYGRVTSLALDPIEKKPLARFFPGSLILSVGSYGCNLRCPFCQNNEISWSDLAMRTAGSIVRQAAEQNVLHVDQVSPEDLAETAEYYSNVGNIGVAFTYNEPLIGYEYVRDTAKLVHEKGMKNVVVTNGTAGLDVLKELAPYVDAMNIDMKGFSDHYYNELLGGSRKMVMEFIEAAVKVCHVELTTLIIPGENDSEEEMAALSEWVAGLQPEQEYYTDAGCGIKTASSDEKENGATSGADIPLHVTRFFPCFHMNDRGPTAVDKVIHLADIARQNLKYVYTGNI